MKIKKLLNNEDAVSITIGFILMFSITVLVFSGIVLSFFTLSEHSKQTAMKASFDILGSGFAARVTSMATLVNIKQSFIVLANNVNKVVMGQAPSQNVELKMYGGSLSVTGNSSINITAINSTNENITLVDRQMRSIESVVGETVVAYEGTGVWVSYPNGNTILVSKPLISNQSKMLIIPVVAIGGTSSVGGSGMSRVTAKGIPKVSVYKNVSNIIV